MSYISKNSECIKYLEKKIDDIGGKIKKIEFELDFLLEEDKLINEILEGIKTKEQLDIEEFEELTGECVHNLVYEGSDSHYSYDVCTKCKETSKY